MQLLLRNWNDRFYEELSKTSELKIISPFVKEQLLRNIGAKFDFIRFELITRFNLAEFALNVSSLDALKFCVHSGANVFGIKGLHSKVYLFDQRCAIVSSANLTNGGFLNNYECGIFTDDSNVVEQLSSYFEELTQFAKHPLSLEQIDLWKAQISSVDVPNLPTVGLPDFGASLLAPVDKGRRYFVKFLGTSSNRVPMTFSTKAEIDRALCHYACGFSPEKKPRQINDDDVIYLARMTEKPDDYAIFGRAEAIKFDDAKDRASEAEIREREWKKAWPYYLRIKNPVFLDGTMGDCPLLYDLVNKFDYLSFASTKKRFDKGERGIKPARSLTQQPYVRLTNESAEWLEGIFGDSLKRCGSVSRDFLDSLPQSSRES